MNRTALPKLYSTGLFGKDAGEGQLCSWWVLWNLNSSLRRKSRFSRNLGQCWPVGRERGSPESLAQALGFLFVRFVLCFVFDTGLRQHKAQGDRNSVGLWEVTWHPGDQTLTW